MKEFEGKMVIFISNFFNHHQRPFSDEMYKAIGAGYVFLETEIIPDERKNMGWDTNISSPYVVRYKKNKHQVLIDSADVVIFGSAPYELIEKRMKSGKLTYVYSERLYKEKCEIYKLPIRFLKQQKNLDDTEMYICFVLVDILRLIMQRLVCLSIRHINGGIFQRQKDTKMWMP